jgi:hypothetical protein
MDYVSREEQIILSFGCALEKQGVFERKPFYNKRVHRRPTF